MKRKTIRFIIGGMSISLIGIITVQIYWILNAVQIKEENFDRGVNEILNELIQKLENKETGKVIQSCFMGIDTRNDTDSSESEHEQGVMQMMGDVFGIKGAVIKKSCDLEAMDTLIKKTKKHVKGKTMQASICIQDDSIPSLHFRFDKDKVKLDLKTGNFIEVIKKMIVENENRHIPIQERLAEIKFDSLLKNSLRIHGYDISFEYSVTPGTSGKEICSAGYNSNYEGKKYCTLLFPNDIIEKHEMLCIYFPSKSLYFMRSMLWILLGSAIFTLALLAFCTGTLWVILRQKKMSEIRNDFISNMTHEFKTPIATISLAADSIRTPVVMDQPQMVEDFCRIIKDESHRMNEKVEKILQLSVFDKQQLQLNFQLINIHEVLMQAIEIIGVQINNKGGSWTTSLTAVKNTIYADADHLLGIFINILDNAIKYSSNPPEINVKTEIVGKYICTHISDKGIGIESNELKKIFERFYRVQTGNIHNVKGFGLGLSYVYEMTALFGGKVSVVSSTGSGSTFSIYLPLR